ncbi:MAG: septum formation family protein [Nocardioides sp.]
MRLLVVPLLLVLLSGCGNADGHVDPDQVDAMGAPDLGACRALTPGDATEPSNASATVPCARPHTAQTYAVGSLPDRFKGASYDSQTLVTWAYQECAAGFRNFTGADESLAMRTIIGWVWFRPSETAWGKGARWFRCDVVGGGGRETAYVDLPTRTKGLLAGQPGDRWLVCANGPSVDHSAKVPCTRKHTWRAVSTIKLGEPGDPYPGDHAVLARTRDFCSQQIGAYLDYPVDYDYGFSWFHSEEWAAGNRRSICWARTSA